MRSLFCGRLPGASAAFFPGAGGSQRLPLLSSGRFGDSTRMEGRSPVAPGDGLLPAPLPDDAEDGDGVSPAICDNSAEDGDDSAFSPRGTRVADNLAGRAALYVASPSMADSLCEASAGVGPICLFSRSVLGGTDFKPALPLGQTAPQALLGLLSSVRPATWIGSAGPPSPVGPFLVEQPSGPPAGPPTAPAAGFLAGPHAGLSSPSKPSFANLLKGGQQGILQPLHFEHEIAKPPELLNDMPIFTFSDDEIAIMSKPLKISAIGFFPRSRPNMQIIRSFFNSCNFMGEHQVSLLDSKHILIRFASQGDLERVRLLDNLCIGRYPIKVWKWEIGYRPDQDPPILPVWMSFQGLPIEFWGGLKSFASIFGHPLKFDAATVRFLRRSMARVLVDFDARKNYLDEILISSESGTVFLQPIIIERRPHYCTRCYRLGHSLHSCYFQHPELRILRKLAPNPNGLLLAQKSHLSPLLGPEVAHADSKTTHPPVGLAEAQQAHIDSLPLVSQEEAHDPDEALPLAHPSPPLSPSSKPNVGPFIEAQSTSTSQELPSPPPLSPIIGPPLDQKAHLSYTPHSSPSLDGDPSPKLGPLMGPPRPSHPHFPKRPHLPSPLKSFQFLGLHCRMDLHSPKLSPLMGLSRPKHHLFPLRPHLPSLLPLHPPLFLHPFFQTLRSPKTQLGLLLPFTPHP
ncbi:hypothetical protein AXF42_Ash004845 [Apostasia shenzhenica]|uniref:Uncharacterized protein n=1 Tax=Apostasia shenzhenica TaxID=1088818 RepID=A0A2I0B7R7_9ASPA|nr:hypothetical protein AXF42_Ash004845 [Apostasia shenzhenica]